MHAPELVHLGRLADREGPVETIEDDFVRGGQHGRLGACLGRGRFGFGLVGGRDDGAEEADGGELGFCRCGRRR